MTREYQVVFSRAEQGLGLASHSCYQDGGGQRQAEIAMMSLSCAPCLGREQASRGTQGQHWPWPHLGHICCRPGSCHLWSQAELKGVRGVYCVSRCCVPGPLSPAIQVCFQLLGLGHAVPFLPPSSHGAPWKGFSCLKALCASSGISHRASCFFLSTWPNLKRGLSWLKQQLLLTPLPQTRL